MPTTMTLFSSSFIHGRPIPAKHSCEGQNQAPKLVWKKPPDNTQSLALIMDDPDAPGGTFVHWVVWNIDPNAMELRPDQLSSYSQGTNSYQKIGYKGPCPPPPNEHRYFFKLYALDSKLTLPPSTTKEELLKAMKGHILERAELMGTYQKKSS